ncbi:M20 family metallo-hydrolase [Synergistaceae bacterium OttesenSCG-928-I11]|nr:M20 family metallo-hydrolase [Synergistaceae bacterium OttesenSCG-928-I11]
MPVEKIFKKTMKVSELTLLQNWFERLAPIGALADGGVTRMGYTDIEDEMHAMFAMFARELGLHVDTDAFGNTFASFDGAPRTDVHLIGSHLDSVPHGGQHDGVAGVLAGLLVMKMCMDEQFMPRVETVAFRCEESSAFDTACVGSSLMLGLIDEAKTKKLKNERGENLYDVLRKRNDAPHPYPAPARFADFLEVHIEQGRILEERDVKVGVVTAIAAPYRFKVVLTGRQDHSGGTPMAMRRDALCGAAEVVLAAEETALSFKGIPLVATVGVVHNAPNALNTVPGETELRVDVRGIEDASILRAVEQIQSKVRRIAARRRLEYRIETIATYPPVDMDGTMRDAIERAAVTVDAPHLSMYSGAGHDAMRMALFVPTGMIFIPCRGGISHNPDENVDLLDVARGARVAYETLRELARNAS